MHNVLIHTVNDRLRLALVKLLVKVVQFLPAARVLRCRKFDSAQVFQFKEVFPADIHAVEHHQRLDELLDAINLVGQRKVYAVKKRHDRLESTHVIRVARILDQAYHAEIVLLALHNLQRAFNAVDCVLHVRRVDRVLRVLVVLVKEHIRNAHQHALRHIAPADNERVLGVQHVHLKWRFVQVLRLRPPAVVDRQAIPNTSSKHLMRQLQVFRLLSFRKHHAVHCGDLVRNRIFILIDNVFLVPQAAAPAHILYGFSRELRRLERNNLVRNIHNNLVVDLRVIPLCPHQHRLLAANILLQEQNLAAVLEMNGQRLGQHRYNILISNLFRRGENLPSSTQVL